MHENEIMNKIIEIESIYPVNEWKINNIDIWPVYRIMESYRLINSENDSKEEQSIQLNRNHKSIPVLSESLNSNDEADFLLFSDSLYRVNLSSYWYNRLSDPFYEAISAMGYKAINLDFSFHNANKAPVIQDTFSIQNQLINSMKLRIRKDIDFISLPYFDEVRNKLIHFKGSKEPLTLINVKYIVNDMLYWIDIFKEILNKKKVKYVLIVNYYQSISHALIFAARELGIATIDVQHGNQVSPYYHNWSIVPGDGYNTLPNFFWTWSENHAEPIRNWTSKTSGHDVIVGGNPWIETWKNNKSNIIKKYSEIASQYINRNKINILVTLQPKYTLGGWTANIPNALLEIIKSSPDNYVFYIRYHHQMLHKYIDESKECEFQLKKLISQGKVETEYASSLPLPFLLKQIDLHITPFSTCVLEAKEFNIPSITLHPRSKLYFQKEIETGWVTEAETNVEIIQAIKALIKLKKLKVNKIKTNENEGIFDIAIKSIISNSEVPDYSNFLSKKETLFSIYFMDGTYEKIINEYNELDSFKVTLYVSDAYKELKDEKNKIKFTIIALEKALSNQEILDVNDIYKIIYRVINEQYFEVYSDNIMSLFNQSKSILGKVLWKFYAEQQYEIIIKLCRYVREQTLDSLYYEGRALLQKEDFFKALDKLNEYIKFYNGDNDFNITYTDDFLISANFYLGQINLKLSDYAQALGNFENCVAFSKGKHQKASEYLEIIKSKLR